MSSRLSRFLLDPQGGEGNGTTATDKDGDKGPDLAAVVDKLISKHGSAADAVRVLLNENHTHRDTIRELKAKVPSDGSVVLAGDDARAWESYRGLGKPEDLRKLKTEHGQFSTEVAGFRRRDHLSEIAGKAAIDGKPVNPKVLATLAGDLEFVVKDGTGKDAPDVLVKHKDADGKDVETPFAKYAAKEWAEFLPSLAPGTAAGDRARGTPRHDGRVVTDDARERVVTSDLQRETAALAGSGRYSL